MAEVVDDFLGRPGRRNPRKEAEDLLSGKAGRPIGFGRTAGDRIATNTAIQGSVMRDQWRQLGRSTQNKFVTQLRIGLRNGESTARMAARISGGTIRGELVPGIMPITRRQATTLVRTSTNAVQNRSRLVAFQNSDMVKAIQQISTLDGRTSQICIAFSGQTWDAETLEPIEGSTLPFNGGPPRHFNCRSSLSPVIKDFEELGLPPVVLPKATRASIDGQVPSDITFADFLKSKTVGFQNRLLGVGRAELWRRGRITLTQLVDMRGSPLSLSQLEAGIAARRARKALPERKPFAPDLDPATAKFDTPEAWRKAFDDPDITTSEIMARATPEQRTAILDFERRIQAGTPTDVRFKKNGVWTASRQELHNDIIGKIFNDAAVRRATPAAGQRPQVTVLGGRGGSGKTFLTQGKGAPVDINRAIVLNADDIKALLPEWDGWNAALLHQETSELFETLQNIARQRRINIVLDVTLGNPGKISRNLDIYQALGYDIEGHYMHLPRQIAAQRAINRATGANPRYVPPQIILDSVANEAGFQALIPRFQAWSMWDNQVPRGATPRRLGGKDRPKRKTPVDRDRERLTFADAPAEANAANLRAFKNAPEDLKKTIGNVGAIDSFTIGVRSGRTKGAYYEATGNGRINMRDPKDYGPKDRSWDGIWAHEMGHHLDFKTGSSFGVPFSARAEMAAARQKASRSLKSKNQTKAGGFTSVAYEDALRKNFNLERVDIRKKVNKLGLNYDKLVTMWKTHWGVTDEIAWNMNRQLLSAIEAKDAGYIFEELLRPTAGATSLARGVWGQVADFFGAMTKNRLGWGHKTSYYKGMWGGIQQGTEMYAQFVSTAAEFPQLNMILRIFAPDFTDRIRDSWKRGGNI